MVVRDQDHDYQQKNNLPIEQIGYMGSPIVIGKNVWIGSHAIILKGVQIGDNAFIGAGAVVTKNVEPNSVVVGNPARTIKRFDLDITHYRFKW